jgi:hypothetical protein
MPSFIWDAATQHYRNLHPKRAPEPINYSELIKQTAISYSFPLAVNGNSHPEYRVNVTTNPNNTVNYVKNSSQNIWTYRQAPPGTLVGDIAKAADMLPVYFSGKQTAKDTAQALGIPYLAKLTRSNYANCSSFTGAVIVNSVDPYFPAINSTNYQHAYVTYSTKWDKVGDSRNYKTEKATYRPGDIFLTPPESGGHTYMWIGTHADPNGTVYDDIVAEASWAATWSTALLLPRLHRISSAIRTNGVDGTNRWYEVWRYNGKSESPLIIRSTNTTTVFSNFRATLRNSTGSATLDENSIIDLSVDLTLPVDIAGGQRFQLRTDEDGNDPFIFTSVDREVTLTDGTVIAEAVKVGTSKQRIEAVLTGNGQAGDVATLRITMGVKANLTLSADTVEIPLEDYDYSTAFSVPISYVID